MGQAILEKNKLLLQICTEQYPYLLEQLSIKNCLDCSQLKYECELIGSGYAANVYRHKKLKIAIKVNKQGNSLQSLCKQIYIVIKASSIWPELFSQIVLDNNTIVGYSMDYIEGKRIQQAYCDPLNIYFRDPSARVRLFKKVKEQVKHLQELKIGHGDLHIDNIMIKQPDQNKEDCQIIIIDYGDSWIIDEKNPQRPTITGYMSMNPPEAKGQEEYITNGVNAYMLGRVGLQILMLRKYIDYMDGIQQSPERELCQLSEWRFDQSVRKEIELYLHNDINVRNRALFEDSSMNQVVFENECKKEICISRAIDGKESLLFPIRHPQGYDPWDEDYYIKNPEKLGYLDE